MIIALSKPIDARFNPKYFCPKNFEHELFHPNHAGSTDLMDPPKVMRELGLSSNYLEEPPFCYIRSYAPIWEYYLVALNASHNKNVKISESVYHALSGTPYKTPGWISLGSGRAVGNMFYDDWKKNYERFSSITKNQEKQRIANLAKESESFVELLIHRNCPIRQCTQKDYDNQERSRFFISRRRAAAAFMAFLLNDGSTLSKEDANALVTLKNIYEELVWLLSYFQKKKEHQESYKHVLSAALLFSLYGHKGARCPKFFIKAIINHVKEFSKDSDLKDNVLYRLKNVIDEEQETYVIPPLAFIYEERDRLSLTLRISSWLHLLEGVLDAQK